jgi:hypothetical protein
MRVPNLGQSLKKEPTVYYVAVEDLADAKETFLSYSNNKIERIEDGDNITLNLKNAKGEPQGNVYFKAIAENDDNYLAEVTFSPENMFPELSKFIFIQEGSWFKLFGIQGVSPYKYLKAVRVPDPQNGNPTGLCIREYIDSKNKGIVIIPMTSNGNYYGHISNCSDEVLLQLYEYIKNKKITNDVENALKGIGLGTLDTLYWSNNKYEYGIWNNLYTVNLKTGATERHTEWGIALPSNNGKNFLCYQFDSNGSFK